MTDSRTPTTPASPPAEPAQVDAAVSPAARRRAVTAIAVGNLFEWYDFAVYSGLAAVLAPLFFPSGDALVSLLASFSVFAVGFLVRPLGAWLFGRMADRYGRRLTLLVVITMMGTATVLIGVMPTAATAGVWAAVLLVVVRTVQGLSVGGEFSSSTAFLVEFAPRGKRGLYGSIAYFTSTLGALVGLIVVLVVRTASSPEFLQTWGWRIPFLLSFPLLMIGLYIRLKVQESPAFRASVQAARTGEETLAAPVSRRRGMISLFGITVGFAVCSYSALAFFGSYLVTALKFDPTTAQVAVIVSATFGALVIPVFGALSDRIGRRPLILAGSIGIVVAAFPAYLLMTTGTTAGALCAMLMMWLVNGFLAGACPAAFSEMFPTRLRSTSIGVSYSIALAVFGGTTPFVSTWLTSATGSLLAPAVFLAATGLVSVVAAVRMRETVEHGLPL